MTVREIQIFILSLPILILALLWIPIGFVFTVVMSPLWIIMCLIDTLKGEEPMWDVWKDPPMMMLAVYSDITGFNLLGKSWSLL